MSKAHRGKGIRELASRGRGECPVCKRNNVKVLYELENEGAKIKVCKVCKAAVAHGKKHLPAAPKKPEAAESAPAEAASAA
jgi:ribosome-binding protein aMBF1 (putative translation factor)